MAIEKVIAIECLICGELLAGSGTASAEVAYRVHIEHDECYPDTTEAFRCKECETVYMEKDEAKECCS